MDTITNLADTTNIPIGTILAYCSRVEDLFGSGWLLCDGAKIPDKFDDLREALSSPNTPNLLGRTLIGAGEGTDANGDKKTFALNESDGVYNITLTEAQMPSHQHFGWGGDGKNNDRNWATGNTQNHNFKGIADPSHQSYLWGSTFSGGQYTNPLPVSNETVTSQSQGTNTSHTNLPPSYAINFIIYAGSPK